MTSLQYKIFHEKLIALILIREKLKMMQYQSNDLCIRQYIKLVPLSVENLFLLLFLNLEIIFYDIFKYHITFFQIQKINPYILCNIIFKSELIHIYQNNKLEK